MASKAAAKIVLRSSPQAARMTDLVCCTCLHNIMSNDVITWQHIWFPDDKARRTAFRKYHKKCAPGIASDAGKKR